MIFSFFKKRIVGTEVDLLPTYTVRPSSDNQYVPSYYFDILEHGTFTSVGTISLRVGMNEELYYLGQVGYSVKPAFRGHHYAYKACLLIFKEAKEVYGMEDLIITCNPDNWPSRKTLERLNGELLEIAPVPRDHYCYQIGEKEKCIFKYKL